MQRFASQLRRSKFPEASLGEAQSPALRALRDYFQIARQPPATRTSGILLRAYDSLLDYSYPLVVM